MLRLLPIALIAATACQPQPEREDLIGLWGRVVDGEHEVYELAEQIDATGLDNVRPAFRMYRYPLDEVPLQVKYGRWDVFLGDLIMTPSWSLVEGEANRTTTFEVDEFSERQIGLIQLDPNTDKPAWEEPVIYTTLSQLPQPSPE